MSLSQCSICGSDPAIHCQTCEKNRAIASVASILQQAINIVSQMNSEEKALLRRAFAIKLSGHCTCGLRPEVAKELARLREETNMDIQLSRKISARGGVDY